MNVLLFIAPVSAFNQTLTEDRTVNRLVRAVFSGLAFVGDVNLHRTTVGLVPPVEIGVRTQVIEKGDLRPAA